MKIIQLLFFLFSQIYQLYSVSYPIVDTNQNVCYGDIKSITCPSSGFSYFGQDAQYTFLSQNYQNNGDGTITDLNTGLTWQKTPDTNKYSDTQASDYINSLNTKKLGGYSDWRLPSIKEIYSLVDSTGNFSSLIPYINTNYFDFQYNNDTSTTVVGERKMDCQYMTSTVYVGVIFGKQSCSFGYNFADGRIKCYPRNAVKFVRAVRGNTNYGKNSFKDQGDGTVLDEATGLMWTKADSGQPYNWKDALAYVQNLTTGNHNDWRLPNTKELQSIVDYTKSPNATDPSQKGPAIDTSIFSVTDETGWYYTSTTLGDDNGGIYIAFGLALGYQNNTWLDVHGAGAQRSDPKSGDNSSYPQGRGPQKDQVRIKNYVRAVRLSSSAYQSTSSQSSSTGTTSSSTTTSTNTTTSSSSNSNTNTQSSSTSTNSGTGSSTSPPGQSSTSTNTTTITTSINSNTNTGGATLISTQEKDPFTQKIKNQLNQFSNQIQQQLGRPNSSKSPANTAQNLLQFQNSLNKLQQAGNNDTLQQQLERLNIVTPQIQKIQEDQTKVQNALQTLNNHVQTNQKPNNQQIIQDLSEFQNTQMTGSDYHKLASTLADQNPFQNTNSLSDASNLLGSLQTLASEQAQVDPLAQVNQTDQDGLKQAQKKMNELMKQGTQSIAKLMQQDDGQSEYFDSKTGLNFQKISPSNNNNGQNGISENVKLNNKQRSEEGGFVEVSIPPNALQKLDNNGSSVVAQIGVQAQGQWSSIPEISNFGASGIVNVNFFKGNDTIKVAGLKGNDRLQICIELLNQTQQCSDLKCGYIDENAISFKYDGTSLNQEKSTNSQGQACCICQAEHTTSFALIQAAATLNAFKVIVTLSSLLFILCFLFINV